MCVIAKIMLLLVKKMLQCTQVLEFDRKVYAY